MKPDGTNYTGAAGTTNITSDTLDTLDFESVYIAIGFGTIVAGGATSVKLQHSDDDSTYNDVKGSNITIADTDDNTVAEYDVYRPLKRYLKVITSRATQNATVDFMHAVLLRTGHAAPTSGTTISHTNKFAGTTTGTP
jgi:hypothetical protein